ncbi:transporter [Prevotella corporis]|uniref:transporter n=1 Tax=Prevotella corporis TaxID=28128 RepID=UPI00040CA369|nr:transporter [Prevotella corporis]MDQ7736627.1 transporter [Prevotella corporis]
MKLITLLKKWTLPMAMLCGVTAYLIFAFVPFLEPAAVFFSPILDMILPLFMFLILYVTFCKVDFRKLVPVRWHLWVGVFQLLFVAIIVGAILVFEVKGNGLILLESILACIIGPCAAAAAVVTLKLGGSLEEMTTYIFLSNFLCAALIPICFPLIEPGNGMGFMASFLLILYKVCAILVVPMLLAYITKHFKPLHRFYEWLIGVRDLSFYLWGCSLTIVTGTTMKNIVHADAGVPFLILIAALGFLVCVLQFAVGRYIGHFFKSTVNAGQSLGQKNTAFAIWIAYTYLNPLASVGPGCYILWQNLINSVEIWYYGKHVSADQERSA